MAVVAEAEAAASAAVAADGGGCGGLGWRWRSAEGNGSAPLGGECPVSRGGRVFGALLIMNIRIEGTAGKPMLFVPLHGFKIECSALR
jgi:hypothetical protein